MKRGFGLFIFIPLSLFMTACSNHQFVVLQSTLPKDKSEKSAFYRSEDDVTMHYAFNGKDGRLNIQVSNDGEEVLYVDVTGSGFFQNGNPVAMEPHPHKRNISNGANQAELLRIYFSGDEPGKVSEVILIPPGTFGLLSAPAPDIEYRKDLDFFRDPESSSLDHPHLKNYSRADLSKGANVFEVRIRMSRDRNFQSSQWRSAFFSESHAYKSHADPSFFPMKTADMITVSRERRGGSGLLLAMTAALLIIAAANDDGGQN